MLENIFGLVFKIDGASVVSELIRDGDKITVADTNKEYKYAMFTSDRWLIASKDGKDWRIAIYIVKYGKEFTQKDFDNVNKIIEDYNNGRGKENDG